MSTIGSAATASVVHRSLVGRRVDVAGTVFQLLLLGSLLFTLAILAILLADVLQRGAPLIANRGADFFTAQLSSDPATTGIGQGLFGTAVIALLVAVVAFPIGIAAAVYLEEYAQDSRLTRIVTVNIRNLAGVPSVVYGLLGLAVFVAALRTLGVGNGRNLISAAVTLGVLVLPIVIITAAEALRAVPLAIREAGYGVGSSRWEVTRKLVLPAATPGILTGTVLALSRAMGETAPIIVAGGVLGTFSTPSDASVLDRLAGSYSTLPLIVFDWSRRPQGDFRELAAAAIVVLLGVTLLANAIAIFLRYRYERSW